MHNTNGGWSRTTYQTSRCTSGPHWPNLGSPKRYLNRPSRVEPHRTAPRRGAPWLTRIQPALNPGLWLPDSEGAGSGSSAFGGLSGAFLVLVSLSGENADDE
ncbi:hypothetical protein SVAN01_07383 [Stagonosporopsis vannaccii]|nr:hypothetical protein SVAN01_07383 [Stagonosporopsis vannaccii]